MARGLGSVMGDYGGADFMNQHARHGRQSGSRRASRRSSRAARRQRPALRSGTIAPHAADLWSLIARSGEPHSA
jgi:hypothetical protein